MTTDYAAAAIAALARKLESITDLNPADKSALDKLPMTVKEVAAGDDIVKVGDRPTTPA